MAAREPGATRIPDGSPGAQPARLQSLDVFRGLTVAGMILVTDPGTYNAVYPPLLHATWDGATATDKIFPSFLFIVGVAMTLSLSSRIQRGCTRASLLWRAFRRSAAIFIIGLVVNGFPDYDLHTLRIPGILQRIALCYLCGSVLYLATGRLTKRGEARDDGRRVAIIATVTLAILAVYWALLKLVAVPGFGTGRLDSLGNLGAYIDRAILGTRHMWPYGLTPSYGVTYDPEGLLSTLPAIATLLLGILAGEWMRTERPARRKLLLLALAGAMLVGAGRLLHPLLPINKRLWTSTFVLFSGGVSLLVFSLCYAVLDLRRWRWWAPPALVFGTNAIVAFALSNFLTTVTDRIRVPAGNGVALTLHQWGYQSIFASWLRPVDASLAFAIAIVLLNLAILLPLYRKRIFLRV
jgi:predicted acyltransferase